MNTIGVDIGGTNTDAVLVDEKENIIKAVKTPTTDDISLGFLNALKQLLAETPLETIQAVLVGTTHATNAILQNKDLYRVGSLRIAGQKPESLPTGYAWPEPLRKSVVAAAETINGGYNCDGSPLTPFCRKEARRAIQKLLESGIQSLAVVGTFSPLSIDQENEVAALVNKLAGPDFPVSLSNAIGGIGFMERENSTLLNAALKKVMKNGFYSLEAALRQLGLNCPLLITQNDGSLIDIQQAIDYPVLTISAGPTNSFIGGSRLAGLEQAVVIDIGGTSTDAGLVRNRFPLRSLNKSTIGGVSLNFSMPDVLSIALGGGSVIDRSTLAIGPRSVGNTLTTNSLCFGGDTLTLTDAALKMGYATIPAMQKARVSLSEQEGERIFQTVQQKLETLIRTMQGGKAAIPAILVGGGAALVPQGDYIIPTNYSVANAYGAALAEVAGCVDTVVSLKNREVVLENLYAQAKDKALKAGACSKSLRLVDQQIIPYSYVPHQMARVVVRFCGKKRG